ncbi:hypothetical protein FACS18942_00070 [Planctomycetales bacterium]|nr:hypothetical protein FACS18942_00070 [Planctomycetales bacterium]
MVSSALYSQNQSENPYSNPFPQGQDLKPPSPTPGNILMSAAVLDTINPIAKSVNIPLKGSQFIYLNAKKPEEKTPVFLTRQDYYVKVKPSKEGTYTGLANDIWYETLYRVSIEGDKSVQSNKSVRGVFLPSPLDFYSGKKRENEDYCNEFYLFANRYGENYLAWIRGQGIEFVEITQGKDLIPLLNELLPKAVYAVNNRYCVGFRFWGASYLWSHIEDEVEEDSLKRDRSRDKCAQNMEILNISGQNGSLEVTIKSKLTGQKFVFVPDKEHTKGILEGRNAYNKTQLKTAPPSWVEWKFGDNTLKDKEKFEQNGFRFWMCQTESERRVNTASRIETAKFVELQGNLVILETLLKKRIVLEMNSLRPEDKEYITKNKKPN